MTVLSKHKGEIGEKNHVGFSGSIESQFSIWPASKTQIVITAEEKTTQSTTKVLENTLIKKLKTEEWNWNKITQVLYYISA